MNHSARPEMETPYADAFFVEQGSSSNSSPDYMLPLVLSLVPVKSAIDVGCGIGVWASDLLKRGVTDVLGIDGDYVNRARLRIPLDCFQAWDLGKPLAIGRRFDLAICLEVAEHLPATRAQSLVEDLVKLAPVVLFSAAIPGQGGVNHINEQYLSYWANLFAARDYVLLDIVRPALWNEERCGLWYRQNAVLFAHKDNPVARLEVRTGVDYVHPRHYEEVFAVFDKPTLGYLLKSIPGSLLRSVRARWKRLDFRLHR